MPGSFLKRHRTICETLEEIRTVANHFDQPDLVKRMNTLVDEAKGYAQSMSLRLLKRKQEHEAIEAILNIYAVYRE